MPPRLHVVTCSTRPTRVGPAVAAWFLDRARGHGGFEVVPVDLREVDLPMYDEPEHPATRRYAHEHTRRWSASVAAADAFVFVTPEYNYGPPPPLLNALDYVYHEWHYKPAGFVGYGGVSGGLRAVQLEKQTLTTLRMMPIPETVSVQFVARQIDEAGRFTASDSHERAATAMLDELLRWTLALMPLRAPAGGG
jgi:NAD(P)H-dependent FMN reductase